MKKYILPFLSVALCFTACKNDPKTATPPVLENHNLNETKTKEKVSFNSEKNQLLYKDYLAIKSAMVNTDGAKTESVAKKLVADFSTDENYSLVKQIASLISSTDDIEKQREFFVGLTEEITKLLKADIKNGKIHQQFCPMAFDGKGGYWLSDSKEIRNPYFGDVMLACGAVTEVLE